MPGLVVGRDDDDLRKFGDTGAILLGKHVVGTGEEAHLTTPLLMDVLRPHLIIVTGKRGTGKCLDGNTLVTTADGRCVPIKHLENENNDILSLDDDLKIKAANKSAFYKRKTDKMMKITMRSGKEIRLTPEHPLLTIKGWKPAQELGIGSRIATPRILNVFGDKEMPDYEIKLLAYLIAEGHIKKHGSCEMAKFTNTDKKIIGDFIESVKNFDGNLRVSRHDDDFSILKNTRFEMHITKRNEKGQVVECVRTVHSHPVAEWLKGLGLYNKLSTEKTIPECVFQLPQEQLSMFLNRLFSCDGSIYNSSSGWEVSYSSSSRTLAEQVQHLLLRFGVLTKLRKKSIKLSGKAFQSFEIVINGHNVDTFLERIGFFGAKENRCAEALKSVTNRNPNIDTIPKEIWDIYRPKNWAETGRLSEYKYPKAMRESIFYSPSRQKLAVIARSENHEGLKLLAESDIFWDEIIGLELLEGEFEVFDITVPEYHNFVANDIIVHNSFLFGIINEEISQMPKNIRDHLCSIIIDTQGIFWTMKMPNEREAVGLSDWDMKPKGFDVSVYVPEGQAKTFSSFGVDYDGVFSILPSQLTVYDWMSVFEIKQNDPIGLLLQRVYKKFQNRNFRIKDIVSAIEDESEFGTEKIALQNMFESAESWGIFGNEKVPDILIPGKVSILDVSLTPQNVRALLVGLTCKKILADRIKARREEEQAEMEIAPAKRVPMPWIFIDEAHNFLPETGKTAASDILFTLVKEGRQPGISLVFATQQPNKLSPDALTQADIVISHSLTARSDIEALGAIMQTYMLFDIGKYINELPKVKGAALVLDDNSERIYKIRVRPRQSWHAGSSPIAL